MTTPIGRLLVTLGMDRREFDRGIKGVEGSVRSLTRSVAGIAGAIGVPIGFAALTRAIIRETVEAEQSQRRLEQAIVATGRAGRIAAPQVNALADSLRQTSTFDDGPIRDAVTALLRFRNIGEQILPQATQAIVDLAAASGGDLQSAARRVGIALNDPIRGLALLKREGQAVPPALAETIKSLVETGQRAKAQEIILRELSASTKGTAAVLRDTLGGSLTALSFAFKKLLEQDSLVGTREEVERLITALGDPEFKESIDTIGVGLTGAFRALASSLAWFVENSNVLLGVLGAVGGAAVAGPPGAVVGGIAGAGISGFSPDTRSRDEKLSSEREFLLRGQVTPEDIARVREIDNELRSLADSAAKAEAASARLGGSVGAVGDASSQSSGDVRQLAEDTAYLDRVLEVLRRPVDTTDLDRVVTALRKQADERERLANDAADAAVDADREVLAEYQANELAKQEALQRPFINAAENIQREFGNLFTDLVLEGEDAFKDLGDTAKQFFARLVGEATSLGATQLLKGFGGLLERVFGGAEGDKKPGADATLEEVLDYLKGIEDSTSTTASNTGGMIDELRQAFDRVASQFKDQGGSSTLALGIAGAGAGMATNQAIGRGNSTGSAVGGLVGAVAGSLLGPIGSIAFGFLGALVTGQAIPGYTDIIKGRNPSENLSHDQAITRGTFMGFASGGVIGAIVGAVLANSAVGSKTRAQIRTSPLDETEGFQSGEFAISPFGNVGLDTKRSQRTRNERGIAEFIAGFDAQIAAMLDPAQLDVIAETLQTTQALRESARRFDKEFNSLLVDRAATISRAMLAASGIAEEQIEKIIEASLPREGSARRSPEDIVDTVQGLADLVRGQQQGRRTLRGDPLSIVEQGLQQLRDLFSDLVPGVLALGGSLQDLQADLAAGEQTLRSEFLRDSEQFIRALTDPIGAALADFDLIAEQRLDDARALGLETILIERRNGLERNRLIEELLDQANSSIDSLLQQMTASTSSPLAFTETLANAAARFEAEVADRRAGDLGADVGGTASALLDLLKSGFASGESFFQGVGEVPGFFEIRSILEDLQVSVPGGDAADEIAGLREEQEAQAARSQALLAGIQAGIAATNARLDEVARELHRVSTLRPAA